MRLRHIVGGLAVTIVAAAGVPAVASAATVSPLSRPVPKTSQWHVAPTAGGAATASSIPWKPYRTKPWHDAPGKVCRFGVNVTIVRQHEQYRTLSSYPNGNPRLQEFRGPLFARYTNTSTGKSVVGNLSGYGWFYYPASGGLDVYIPNHIDVTVPVGNRGFPAGEWIVSGRSLVIIDSTGAINIVLIHATTENICRTLS
ncbi:MAG TPA: hypothetical protein VKS82_14990 [Streptosporangiaceae bacterium]|jgi:hypothetical protein|nr:hypothetical protein [Streptosporangiaceae bacterium]